MLNNYITHIVDFITNFVFVFVGVYGKDYIDTLSGEDVKIYILRIFIMSFIVTTLMTGIESIITEKTNQFLFLFLCISGGWGNYYFYSVLNKIGKKIANKADNLE